MKRQWYLFTLSYFNCSIEDDGVGNIILNHTVSFSDISMTLSCKGMFSYSQLALLKGFPFVNQMHEGNLINRFGFPNIKHARIEETFS